jgi:hypothetical protein
LRRGGILFSSRDFFHKCMKTYVCFKVLQNYTNTAVSNAGRPLGPYRHFKHIL